MKQDNNIIILEKLLNEFKFVSPVSVDDQKYILSRKGVIFNRVIKSVGAYGTAFGLSAYVYFLLKKYGIFLSVSKIMVAAAGAALIATGAGVAVKSGLYKDIKSEAVMEKTAATKNITITGQVKYVLGMGAFRSETLTGDALDRVEKNLYDELIRLKGKEYLRYRVSGGAADEKYALVGAVEKYGNAYTLTLSVVDTEKDSASVIFITRRKAESAEDLEKACVSAAREITYKIK